VERLHDEADPNFGGLHPEPIPPWTDAAGARGRETGLPVFVTDGDGDRIGAVDEAGDFVSAHKIIALIAQHLVEDKGLAGRIVRSFAVSVLVERIGRELGCEVSTTPIGFKWIYEEMLAGDVLVGGEESGGIGAVGHVRERDGLFMTLLLVEMMAQRDCGLKDLIAALERRVGRLYYNRRDLHVGPTVIKRVRQALPTLAPPTLAGLSVGECDRTDGAKFLLAGDAWLLLRASGTEPLVRVYAEADTLQQVEALLDAGCALVEGS
jgi:phosphomannomutase